MEKYSSQTRHCAAPSVVTSQTEITHFCQSGSKLSGMQAAAELARCSAGPSGEDRRVEPLVASTLNDFETFGYQTQPGVAGRDRADLCVMS